MAKVNLPPADTARRLRGGLPVRRRRDRRARRPLPDRPRQAVQPRGVAGVHRGCPGWRVRFRRRRDQRRENGCAAVKLHYDTEFLEDGKTIDLISIGMVREDGAEYYAENSEADWDRMKKSDWLVRNVLPGLKIIGRKSLDTYLKNSPNSFPRPPIEFVDPDVPSSLVKPRQVIANEVRDFILAAPEPELWAWYAAYDHVALCQLWGPMTSLPKGIPMWTNDLKQEAQRLGDSDLPSMPGVAEHNALSDAREVAWRHQWLAGRTDVPQRTPAPPARSAPAGRPARHSSPPPPSRTA